MAGNLQPLDEKFAIVGPDGRPTLYFIKWAQQRQIDITGAITAEQFNELLVEYLLAHQLQEGSGIQITPSGNISDSPTIAADVQEILDQISTTQGSIIYRNASDWVALAPGTSGNFLKTNGAGADPAWAAAPAGGTDWIDLTFTTSAVLWGGRAWFASSESITLTGTDKIEMVLQCDRDAGEWMGICISPDVNNCYMSIIQNDNNYVLYSYDTSGGASTVLSGGVVNQVESGNHELRMIIHLAKLGTNDRIASIANSIDFKSARTANTILRVATNKIYLNLPNDTLANKINCAYRVNSRDGR